MVGSQPYLEFSGSEHCCCPDTENKLNSREVATFSEKTLKVGSPFLGKIYPAINDIKNVLL